MNSNIWSAWWRTQFCPDEYLYHYTTFDGALKIIYGDKLRFSPLSATNDTAEQKLRICYPFRDIKQRRDDVGRFEKYCQDRPKASSNEVASLSDIFDVRGRGFALPRMWAQYASNHNGVCLAIRKDAFLSKVKKAYPESINKEVAYFDWAESYQINRDDFNDILQIILHNSSSTYAPNFLQSHTSFTDYLYFMKLKDWEGEREYRIIIPSCDAATQYLYIEGVKDILAGVIVGEKMDSSQISAIKAMLPDTVHIRRIVFELSKCSLKNLEDI